MTPREIVLLMAWIWGLGWLWLGLPALATWGQHVTRYQVIEAAILLCGFAFAPLAFLLTAIWLPRLFARVDDAKKKSHTPHPLD